MTDVLLTLQLATTLTLTGVIWYVQLVHYPLFAMADRARFAQFERRHSRATGRVVAPLMIVEAISALAFMLTADPDHRSPALAGALLVAAIWLSTFLLQVPCHRTLGTGFDANVHRRLLRTNWIRTLAWSGRSAILLWIAAR